MNLPAKDKMIPPAYQGLEADQVTLVSTDDGGGLVRVIAGRLGDLPRTRLHPYADDHDACQRFAGGTARAAVGPQLQRPSLRAGRVGAGRK